MNALATQDQANAVANTNVGDPFAAVGNSATGQSTYVKFKGASGEYLAGQNEDTIAHGTKFAADLGNTKWIWTFWWDGKPVETVEALLTEKPLFNEVMPDFLPESEDADIDMTLDEIKKMQKEDPQNFRDGWTVQASFGMRPTDGSDEEYTMRLGGMVSLNAFAALCRAYGRRYKLEQGKQPIIELTANKYKSKKAGVGTRSAPVLKIIEWLSEEELMEAAGEMDGDYDDYDDYDDEPKAIEKAAEPEKSEENAPAVRGRRGARDKKFG